MTAKSINEAWREIVGSYHESHEVNTGSVSWEDYSDAGHTDEEAAEFQQRWEQMLSRIGGVIKEELATHPPNTLEAILRQPDDTIVDTLTKTEVSFESPQGRVILDFYRDAMAERYLEVVHGECSPIDPDDEQAFEEAMDLVAAIEEAFVNSLHRQFHPKG